MKRSTSMIGVGLASLLAVSSALGAPAKSLKAGAAERFLRNYGYARSLKGSDVVRPDGSRVALSALHSYDDLYALTHELPRAKFKGLSGLSSEQPAMKVVLHNVDRAAAEKSPSADFATALSELDLVTAHDAALRSDAPLARKATQLSTVYLQAGAPKEARLLARKVQRLRDGEVVGSLARIEATDRSGNLARAETLMKALYRDHPDDAQVELGYAKLLRISLQRPADALAMARQAVAHAPADPRMQLELAQATRYAAQKGVYTDTKGKAGSTSAGYAASLEQFRAVGRLGLAHIAVALTDMVVPQRQLESETNPILAKATRAFDNGDYDRAEKLGKQAAAIDPDHALAYRAITASMLARRAVTAKALLGRSTTPKALQTEDGRKKLVRQARAQGIARLVPGFESESPARQATIAYSMLPLRAYWSRLPDNAVVLMPIDKSVSDLRPSMRRDELTFDGRKWYGTRGLGSQTQAIVASYEIDGTADGHYAVLAHEFAHLVHHNLEPAQRAKITELFNKKNALDDYASQNEFEYFAQGFEASVSIEKDASDVGGRGNTRAKLEARDPELAAFIRSLTDPAS